MFTSAPSPASEVGFRGRFRSSGGRLRGVLLLSCVLLVGVFAAPRGGEAQSGVQRLFDDCRSTAPAALEGPCADAGLALQAFHGGMGLLMGAGGPIPASPSTAGRRLSSQSRIVVDGGLGWASFRHPDLGVSPGSAGPRDRRTLLPSGRISTAVGVFEGFSPVPNVGGVLAVDAVGSVQLVRLPRGFGSSGSLFQWGGGVRLGVVRESFTLPGVTLSLMHYRAGRFQHGVTEETGAQFTLNPRATSLRLAVGRDLLAVGLTGGMGWDRYGGTGRIGAMGASGSQGTAPQGAGGPASLRTTRTYLFAGANFTWVVAQFAGEIAWPLGGGRDVELPGTGPFRTGSRELQGALSFRITY